MMDSRACSAANPRAGAKRTTEKITVTSRSALTRLATCQGWRLIAGPLLVAAALLAWASVAMAEGYPSRRITLIVPVAPGGPVDLAARVIANEASTLLGQPITVDNRPGASQKIGMQAVMRAPKDGYTFGAVSPASMSINPLIDPSIGYDPLKDFTLLSQSVGYVMVVLVRPSLAVKSLEGSRWPSSKVPTMPYQGTPTCWVHTLPP